MEGVKNKGKKRSVERDKDLERRLRERKNRGTREKIIEEETEKKGTTTYLSRRLPKNRLEPLSTTAPPCCRQWLKAILGIATRKGGAPPL